MGYIVDFDALDTMYAGVSSNVNGWAEKLVKLSEKNTALTESDNMSGKWADSIKSYLGSVHGTIIPLFQHLTALLNYNCLLYKHDYQSNIDTALHAHIPSDDLDSIKMELEKQKSLTTQIDGEVGYALGRIKDIFSIRYQDSEYVVEAHQQTISYLSKLDESIKRLELRHDESDFTAVDDMISALRTFITEMQSKSRGFKTGFSMTALAATDSFKKLYDAHLAVTDELDSKAEAIETAINNENQRLADLQAEYEERQKKAQTVTWIVTGICIIGSIVAIAATGGAATPLVVGAISAASSAVIAGTNNLANQYVQDGDLNDVDWGSFGKDVAVGGITGFVTGYLGAAIGGGISSGLGKTATGSSLLNSTNSAVRIGTKVVIGSVSEVTSGVASRGAGTFISSGFDAKEAVKDAFDPKNMVLDAALGGADGAISEISSLQKAQAAADDAASSYNKRYDPLEAGEANGLANLKQTKNGGVDFSDSEHILRTENGDPIQVTIKSTGSRAKDYKQAEQILREEYGIDIDFKSMRTGDNATHVWHHVDDYNVMTNETTMQFIEIDAHRAIENHSGSANQYYIAHGKGYGKQGFETSYQGIEVLPYVSPIINNATDTAEKLDEIPGFAYGVN